MKQVVLKQLPPALCVAVRNLPAPRKQHDVGVATLTAGFGGGVFFFLSKFNQSK